jgi:hypothetical protein
LSFTLEFVVLKNRELPTVLFAAYDVMTVVNICFSVSAARLKSSNIIFCCGDPYKEQLPVYYFLSFFFPPSYAFSAAVKFPLID